MNIKKMLTTLSAMVVAVMFTLPNASVFAATYSAELTDAYNWAYSKGVTTQSPIDNANMYGAITRAEMAKMLSVYAMEVLGLTPDTSRACTFTDIASVKGDLHDYIITSCQLGIMGQGITEFRPYAQIPRSEFGTALSRTLWGSTYDGGTPFYAKHLDALKAAGIMTQISNAESMKEVRGYVMLMLMRSEGNDAVVDCEDPMTVIACTTDAASCPAACREAEDNTPTVVKAGDLAVSATAAEGRKAVLSLVEVYDEDNDDTYYELGGVTDLDTLTFKTSEEVTLNKVVLERYGYSAYTTVKNVWLEDQDGNQITDPKPLTTKDTVTLNIKKDYRTIDGTFKATVVVEMWNDEEEEEFMSALGGTIGFKVIDADSSAKNLNLDDYTPYTYDIVFYKWNSVTLSRFGNNKDYNYEEGEMYELARFKVKSNGATTNINGFTLKNNARQGLELHEFLDKLEVTVGGEKVSGLKYSVNKDDELTISFNTVELEINKSAVVVVSVSLQDYDAYDSVAQYGIRDTTDFSATEKKTWARVTVSGLPNANSEDTWAIHVFKAGKIKITGTKLSNVDAAQGKEDVVIAEWTITVSAPFTMSNYTLTVNGGTTKAVDSITMVVAGEEYEATCKNDVCKFPKITFEKSGKIQFLMDVYSEAHEKDVLTFNPTTFGKAQLEWAKYDDISNEYVSSSDVVGSIAFVNRVTIQPAKASLENNLTKDVEFILEETSRKVVFDGTYTAKKGDVYLNKVTLSGEDFTDNDNEVTFYVSIDGDEVAELDLNDEASFSNIKVKAWESVKVKVEAEVSAYWVEETLSDIEVRLNGEDANQNEGAGEGFDTLTTIKLKAKGSVTVSAATSKKTVLLKGRNQTLATFTIKPANGNEGITLSEITFGASIASGDIRVKVDGVLVDAEEVIDNSGLPSNPGWQNVMQYLPNEELPANGVVVEVTLRNDTLWLAGIEVLTVNEKAQSGKLFLKQYEEALAYITKQEGWDGVTTFTLWVDKSDADITVSGFEIGYEVKDASGNVQQEVYPAIQTAFEDGDTFTVEEDDSAHLIKYIGYYVAWDDLGYDPSDCDTTVTVDSVEKCTGYYVEIYKDGTFWTPDYFKVNGADARIFKSK